MTEERAFPLNAWYAVAWSDEIKHELTARTICDQDVVL
jgi:phenylpropionate dioxygenase-like ring-hydroxylating dioxygenase large terminal subunit